MATFELVIGPMRSGKTTYAKTKPGFLSFDARITSAKGDFNAVFREVVAAANCHATSDYVIDGWFSIHNSSSRTVHDLRAAIPQEVKLTGFYAPMDTLLGRGCELDPGARARQTRPEIVAVYERMRALYAGELRSFDFSFRTSDGPLGFYEFSKRVRGDGVTASLDDVLAFERRLASRGHDIGYQTIPLPFGLTIESREENTILAFEQAMKIIDFRGRSVLDCGCYHCQLAFAAEDAGARRVVGVDKTQPALDTAGELKAIWNYRTELVCADLDAFNPADRSDVVLCFNTLQYVKDPVRVVRTLFDVGDLVVWESSAEFKPLYDGQSTHRLIHQEESLRWRPPSEPRFLYYYEREAA